MRLLLLASMATVIGATTTHAHTDVASITPVCSIPADSLSADSLQKLLLHVDCLSVFDLKKWRESYIYKNRVQPSGQNREILAYIEDRLKVAK